MGDAQLREAPGPGEDGVMPGEGGPLPPLRVRGLVARKADLIAALRVYVPGLTDIQVTDDGEHFWLMLGEEGQDEGPTAR